MRLSFVYIFCCVIAHASANNRIEILRTPDGGIQPQAVADKNGAVHLIYFKGEGKGGNIFYVRRNFSAEKFSAPIQINSLPDSAIAIGTIRGAQIALGKNGRVHIVWNGNGEVKNSTHHGPPLWYARLDDAGNAFETQRDLITRAGGLDGGSAIAADSQDNVYAMWHGSLPENTRGEAGRAVFISRSIDGGKTFFSEKAAMPKPTGACACCGMRAVADDAGNVFALYRGASEKTDRAEILLASHNHGETFEIANEHPWKIAMCPMSTAALTTTTGKSVAAWETAGRIYFATNNLKTSGVWQTVAVPSSEKQKHPSVAANAKGEILLAWTEGTGWNKGGSLAWQLFDARGNATDEKGRAPGVPVWSLVSCGAKPDGGFLIFY